LAGGDMMPVDMPWEKAVAARESRMRARDSRFLVAALLGMTRFRALLGMARFRVLLGMARFRVLLGMTTA